MNIDNCICGSHYDISLYVYESLQQINYKYIENDIFIKNYIKSVIVNDFIKKSLYYTEIIDQQDGNELKSVKLLEIANKLKNDKFVKDILKELRQFYF